MAIKIGENNALTGLYTNKVMKNHHGGVILVDGYLYGHSDGVGWVCQNFKTGEEVWAEQLPEDTRLMMSEAYARRVRHLIATNRISDDEYRMLTGLW